MDSAEQTPDVQAPRAASDTVLRRMIAARQKLQEPVIQAEIAAVTEAEIDTERAAGRALGRAAERLHRLPIFVEKTEIGPASLAELIELLPDRPLLAIIEARDQFGVVALCNETLAALIEIHALGRVTSRPVLKRRTTRTDAMISADFVNCLLEELGQEMPVSSGLHIANTFRYVSYLDDPRPLALMLEDVEMVRVSKSFRIGLGGQREGKITLAVPVQKPVVALSKATNLIASTPVETEEEIPPTFSLHDAVYNAPVQLNGILCRREISLRALQNLTVGSLIQLPANALEEATLETDAGQIIARGKLGEKEGFHALRLASRNAGAASSGTIAEVVPAIGEPLGSDEVLVADLDQPDPFRSDDLGDLTSQQATG